MKKNNPTKTSLMQQLAAAQAWANDLTQSLAKVRKELEETKDQLDREMIGFEKWRDRAHDAEITLIRTYNILTGFDVDSCTPIDEAMGLIQTAASVTRKQLVALTLKEAKSAKK